MTMDINRLKSNTKLLVEQRNGYLVLALALSAICLMLILLCFYLANRERVIVTPPVMDQQFWLSNDHVSSAYLSKMTQFYADLRFNVTASNADYQHKLLLQYTAPNFYGALSDQLVAETDQINQAHVSTAFYPVDTQVDTQALTVLIIGDLLSTVGATLMPNQRVQYLFSYRYDNGQLLIKNIQEVKNDGK